MPELAVKIKTAPNNRSTTINGTSHHFFSCFEKRQNSFRSDHMSWWEFRIYPIARKENVAAPFANELWAKADAKKLSGCIRVD